MRQKLTLSRETLRTLDEDALTLIVGGTGKPNHKAKTGNSSCNAKTKNPHLSCKPGKN